MNLCTYRVFITKGFYSRLKVRIISLSLMFYRIKHQKQNKRDQTQTLENNPEQRGGLNSEYMCVTPSWQQKDSHHQVCVWERKRTSQNLHISWSHVQDLTVSTPVGVSIKHLSSDWRLSVGLIGWSLHKVWKSSGLTILVNKQEAVTETPCFKYEDENMDYVLKNRMLVAELHPAVVFVLATFSFK